MQPITTPELPKLIVNGNGKYKYVFTYTNAWNKEAKQSRRQKGARSVGRYVPVEGKEGCGEIFFSEEFKAEHPELDVLRVFRYKGGRMEFKPIDDETHRVVEPQVVRRLHGGATWALNQIVGQSVIGRALKAVFPKYNVALKLLSLAYYLVIERNSSLCDYEEFAECTWLPYQRALTGGAISRMLKRISRNDVLKLLKHLSTEYRKDHGDEIREGHFWALDSTSITSYSTGITSVEYGHNKDLMEAPQTNVLLIVDQKTGELVYWRNFDGNVPDVSTVRNTIAELAAMKIDTDNVVLVTDRGYGSRANYDDLLRNGISFINNTRLNQGTSLKELVDKNYSGLLDWNNEISFINQTAVTVPIEWFYDEFPVKGKKAQRNSKKTVYAHIYFSQALHNEATANLKQRLSKFVENYNKNPEKAPDDSEQVIQNYLEKTKDGKVRISMSKVDQRLRYAGVRVLMSDAISDARECYVAYEERNQVEYAFNTLKSRLNCNRTQVESSEAWESKLMLQMIATAIAGMVRARVKSYNDGELLKKAAGTGPYRVHYDSDHKLLRGLNNVSLSSYADGWVFDEIAGKRKTLFTILGVEVPTVGQFAPAGVSDPDDEPLVAEFEAELAAIDGAEDL